MIIHSLRFFGFVLVVLIIYYLLPRQKQNVLLLIASYFFYITISWHFALVLLLMTAANYFLGHKTAAGAPAKKWLRTGIGLNLGVMLFFKYVNFFVPDAMEFLSRLGLPIQLEGLKILMPVGLSFYVLQVISYLVDVYRGQIAPCSNSVDFALYLAYFPKLTAGPIERARTFLPQLAKQRKVDNQMIARSFSLIIIGLVRKVVIADTLLLAVPTGVSLTPLDYSPVELVGWLLAYAFGLYNDFCGYTNIVRGISAFFGIELSRNFINPIFSRSFAEVWNRWHITLSSWLRDYIYFPLGRALVRRFPRQNHAFNIILPPMVTMLASGLWHGPAVNFLVWGALMGIFMVIERILSLRGPVVAPDRKPMWKQVLSRVVITSLGIISSVFTFMSTPAAFRFFLGLFTGAGQLVLPASRVFLLFIPMLWIEFMQHRRKDELLFLSWPLVGRASLLALAGLLIFLFAQTRLGTPFIYQGF